MLWLKVTIFKRYRCLFYALAYLFDWDVSAQQSAYRISATLLSFLHCSVFSWMQIVAQTNIQFHSIIDQHE